MFEIASLHYITQDNIPEYSHADLVREACEGGVRWVQLRSKTLPYYYLKKEAAEVKNICRQYNAKMIINDNVVLAKEIGSDGVHLGKEDMDPVKAREILGQEAIIGGTANTFKDIKRLAEANVDYIGLGPFRFTSTKENLSPILGIEGYRQIIIECKKSGIEIPTIAIGGIKPEDIESLINVGVQGVAVSSYINLSSQISKTAEIFIKILRKQEQN